ncbi:MAG TPA: hydroxyisourate hydrolase [Blastocatellia bacterium]|nr:hydroxyisourate hydrolase [Blastocatellia bacterium]
MSAITTHILDTSLGRPARGVPVTLEFQAQQWQVIGKGITDDDGRLRDLLPDDFDLQSGNYRITFDTGVYFSSLNLEGFYPEVSVIFTIRDHKQHFHVPLLLSPFGYSTYRGS